MEVALSAHQAAFERAFVRGLFAHLALEGALGLVGQLGELAQRREVAERLQAEELEEIARGAVEDRAARLVFFAEHAHEVALQEGFEHRAGVHAADVVDLGARDRLAIGHDRQRLDLGS